MISILFLLSSFTQPKCDTLPLNEEIQLSTFIGIVEMVGVQNKYTVYIKVKEFFKGGGYTDIRLDPWDMNMEIGKQYLIFARKDSDYENHYIPDCSRSMELEKVDKKILDYLDERFGHLLCFDPLIKQKYQSGACEKIIMPVCGCNGITYSNPCMARKAGIMKFTHGECK